MREATTHVYLSVKSRPCGFGSVTLFQGWFLSTGFPAGPGSEGPLVLQLSKYELPSRISIGEVDLDQVGRDQLAADRDPGVT